MKTQNIITKTVRPQATVAAILGTQEPQVSGSRTKSTRTATPAHSIPPALREEAAKFREEIRRRYETPFRTGWDHGGLNE